MSILILDTVDLIARRPDCNFTELLKTIFFAVEPILPQSRVSSLQIIYSRALFLEWKCLTLLMVALIMIFHVWFGTDLVMNMQQAFILVNYGVCPDCVYTDRSFTESFSPMICQINGALTFFVYYFDWFFLRLIITCRLWVIYVREDNYSNA